MVVGYRLVMSSLGWRLEPVFSSYLDPFAATICGAGVGGCGGGDVGSISSPIVGTFPTGKGLRLALVGGRWLWLNG